MSTAAIDDAVREATDTPPPPAPAAAAAPAANEVPPPKEGDEPAAKTEEPAAKVEEGATEAKAEGAEGEAAEQPDWRDKELKRKHAKLKEAEREKAELAQRVADLERIAQGLQPAAGAEGTEPAAAPAAAPPARPATYTQDEIRREAARLVEQQNFDNAVREIGETGQKTYGQKWTRALENLATFGEVDPTVMKSIMATDKPEKVFYELGANPAEYQRIMELTPERRHTEFVKLSLKAEARPAVSNAPAPVEPLRGTPAVGRSLEDKLRDDKMSDDEWNRAWDEHMAARAKKRA